MVFKSLYIFRLKLKKLKKLEIRLDINPYNYVSGDVMHDLNLKREIVFERSSIWEVIIAAMVL